MSEEIVLTAVEKGGIYFIPSAVGGKQVDEAVQLSLQAKGLITAPLADGRRVVTRLEDRVRQGAVKSRVQG
ncbi:hypothetical protein [Pelomonas sp. KK5]|uniref:hypothetical protein n=1 Tax=Pelomonas sp. KK5 TaxID=1855730 RepID=UPI00097C82E7|nr:hypothetical protein [Pelomonas sp. KK5]